MVYDCQCRALPYYAVLSWRGLQSVITWVPLFVVSAQPSI